MRCQVIKELLGFEHGVFCPLCLLVGNGTESHEACEVHRVGVVEDAADKLLNMLYILF